MKRSDFREILLVALKREGRTLTSVAREIGVTKQAVSYFLNDKTHSLGLALRLCEAVGVDCVNAYETCAYASRVRGRSK